MTSAEEWRTAEQIRRMVGMDPHQPEDDEPDDD